MFKEAEGPEHYRFLHKFNDQYDLCLASWRKNPKKGRGNLYEQMRDVLRQQLGLRLFIPHLDLPHTNRESDLEIACEIIIPEVELVLCDARHAKEFATEMLKKAAELRKDIALFYESHYPLEELPVNLNIAYHINYTGKKIKKLPGRIVKFLEGKYK